MVPPIYPLTWSLSTPVRGQLDGMRAHSATLQAARLEDERALRGEVARQGEIAERARDSAASNAVYSKAQVNLELPQATVGSGS